MKIGMGAVGDLTDDYNAAVDAYNNSPAGSQAEADAAARIDALQTQINATGSTPWYEDILGIGKQVLTLAQMKQLQDINLQRAQKGLTPLSAAQYAPTLNVGVASETQRMVLLMALGLGAVILLPALLKNRR